MKISATIGFITIFLFICISGCKKDQQEVHYFNAGPNGIDDATLFNAIEKARADKGILSIIVYRNNAIIAEEYFGSNSSDTYHPIRSVTKSVTSILFGLANDLGMIEDLDATIGNYLTEYLVPEDSVVSGVSIRNLLTMSGGFEWEELSDYTDFNDWVLSDDHLVYALQVPIVDTPGTKFTYTTPGCQILSAIFTIETGYTLKSFAEEFLFPEININGPRPWDVDQHGYNYGGITLNLNAQDMLKIGVLYLKKGSYNGVQVLSENWIVQSTAPHIDTYNDLYYADKYGYLWWIGGKSNIDYYFANGYGGQFIFVFPDLHMIVIAQSEINNDYNSPNEQWVNTISIILDDILNSVE